MGLLQPDVGHGGRDRQSRLNDPPKAVTIHCLAHAAAAIAAAVDVGAPLLLLSAPSAAGYAGPAWFVAVIESARRSWPDVAILPVLDCGDRTGHALAALRHGVAGIRYNGTANERIRALARLHGATVFEERPPSLDLADHDDESAAALQAACRGWLAS